MQAAGRIINRKYHSYSEVLMKTIIKALLVLSISVVFGATFSFAQTTATRVQAEIPFDFAIGDKFFPAGNYSFSLIRRNGVVHSVYLRDDRGKMICNTVAVQNGSSTRERSEMVFADAGDRKQLEKLTTPEFGYLFSRSGSDKHVAAAGRVSIPASTAMPN
jgi:hypothetical protein